MTSVQIGQATPAEQPEERVKRLRSKFRWYVTFPFLLFLVGMIAGFTTNFIPSSSMEPNIKTGDHILTMRSWIAYPMGRIPTRGDVIVFQLPLEKVQEIEQREGQGAVDTPKSQGIAGVLEQIRGNILIKRVIGLPGDTVQLKDGVLLVNDQPYKETYPTIPMDPDYEQMYPYGTSDPIKVPAGEVFVLGDNRDNSDDGRMWGTLPRSAILGKYLMTVYHEKEGGRNRKKADGQSENAGN